MICIAQTAYTASSKQYVLSCSLGSMKGSYKFTILLWNIYVLLSCDKCPVLRIKTKTKLQNFVRFISIFFLQIITKISTREIRFPNICEIKYGQKLVRSRIRYLFPTCMPSRTFITIDKNNIIGRASEELPTAWQPPTSFVMVTENWKFQQSCRCCDWILSPCLIQGTAILNNSRWFSLCILKLINNSLRKYKGN